MLKKSAFFIIIFTGLSVVYGQQNQQSTADEIEMLLNTRAVTYAQAARFVLEASDAFISSEPQEAFNFAVNNNWLPANAAANDQARFDGFALLLVRSFEIKGGLMFSLTKSPHYAYRELEAMRLIHGRVTPRSPVSGDQLLFIVNRLLAMQEASTSLSTNSRVRGNL